MGMVMIRFIVCIERSGLMKLRNGAHQNIYHNNRNNEWLVSFRMYIENNATPKRLHRHIQIYQGRKVNTGQLQLVLQNLQRADKPQKSNQSIKNSS